MKIHEARPMLDEPEKKKRRSEKSNNNREQQNQKRTVKITHEIAIENCCLRCFTNEIAFTGAGLKVQFEILHNNQQTRDVPYFLQLISIYKNNE